jgi:hypothetical protein
MRKEKKLQFKEESQSDESKSRIISLTTCSRITIAMRLFGSYDHELSTGLKLGRLKQVPAAFWIIHQSTYFSPKQMVVYT